MQTLTTLAFSEPFLNLLAFVAVSFWTLFKSSQWYRQRRSDTLDKTQSVLEAAVEQAYQDIVAEMKRLSPDGKLTPEQQQQAQAYALDRAKEIGTRAGLDVVKTIGPDFIRTAIVQAVRRLKGTHHQSHQPPGTPIS